METPKSGWWRRPGASPLTLRFGHLASGSFVTPSCSLGSPGPQIQDGGACEAGREGAPLLRRPHEGSLELIGLSWVGEALEPQREPGPLARCRVRPARPGRAVAEPVAGEPDDGEHNRGTRRHGGVGELHAADHAEEEVDHDQPAADGDRRGDSRAEVAAAVLRAALALAPVGDPAPFLDNRGLNRHLNKDRNPAPGPLPPPDDLDYEPRSTGCCRTGRATPGRRGTRRLPGAQRLPGGRS